MLLKCCGVLRFIQDDFISRPDMRMVLVLSKYWAKWRIENSWVGPVLSLLTVLRRFLYCSYSLCVCGLICGVCSVFITKTRLFKYNENFTTKKGKFSGKQFWYFSYFCQNTDCGYSLEPPRRGGSNEYPQPMFLSRNRKNNVYPCKPQFYYIKMGFKGVKII